MKPSTPIRVTVWNEFIHEREKETVRKIYPDGIHTVVAEAITEHLGEGCTTRTATLDQDEHGLTEEILQQTDVLFWWGHAAHDKVDDAIVTRVQQRVLDGMGLVVLHSGHEAKIFQRLMGTKCSLRWREEGEIERLWFVRPGHPILAGLEGEYLELPTTEMYGEYFDIPQPDELLTISWFEGGEVCRSGCTFHRGRGKIFYFRPGHETYPIYYNPGVRRILANAAAWAVPSGVPYVGQGSRHSETPLNPIKPQ